MEDCRGYFRMFTPACTKRTQEKPVKLFSAAFNLAERIAFFCTFVHALDCRIYVLDRPIWRLKAEVRFSGAIFV